MTARQSAEPWFGPEDPREQTARGWEIDDHTQIEVLVIAALHEALATIDELRVAVHTGRPQEAWQQRFDALVELAARFEPCTPAPPYVPSHIGVRLVERVLELAETYPSGLPGGEEGGLPPSDG